jgi:hypothetical protein
LSPERPGTYEEVAEVDLPATVADTVPLSGVEARSDALRDRADVHPLDPDVRVVDVKEVGHAVPSEKLEAARRPSALGNLSRSKWKPSGRRQCPGVDTVWIRCGYGRKSDPKRP